MKRMLMLVAGIAFACGAAATNPAPRTVDEGKLGLTHDLAEGTPLVAPGYPAAYADRGDDVCIALGYTVQPDGSTGDFQLLQAWGSNLARMETQGRYLDAFVNAAAHAVSQWRFVPKGEASPVRTVATLTFNGAGSGEDVASRCRIDDLAAHYRFRENSRVAVQREMERRRDAATLSQVRWAESVAPRPSAPQPPPSPQPQNAPIGSS